MKFGLKELLKEQKLKDSKHNILITNISNNIELSNNVITMFKSAYFKKQTEQRLWEGEIDLLAMHYFHKDFPNIAKWEEVPYNNGRLLLFKMKTVDSSENYHKAISQLKEEKSFIKTFTKYQNIDCFYSFYVGNSFVWRFEKEL